MGESEPLDDYRLSHGICSSCLALGAIEDPDLVLKARPLLAFFEGIRESSKTRWQRPAREVLAEAVGLGIRPLELLTGIMQPALEEIGALWKAGQVSVAAEHQFTRMVGTVLELISIHDGALPPPPSGRGVEFLLFNAEGNFHILGLRVVELLLRARERSALAVVPGLPLEEARDMVRELRPRVVGVSASMAEQAEAVEALARMVQSVGSVQPLVVVGGAAVRGKRFPAGPSPLIVLRDPLGLLDL